MELVTALTLLAILAGCVLLYFGAESLVVGASTIATALDFPKAIAGLTLVAVGTSAPELFVNLLSASRGYTEFAMSNISGSNLANLCFGFGCCALLSNLPIPRKMFVTDLVFLSITPPIVAGILLLSPQYVLNRSSIALFTIGLVIYGGSLLRRALAPTDEIRAGNRRSLLLRGILRFTFGAVLLYAGAEIVLAMSVRLAEALSISEAVIGLTIVAAGTSVPDITASIVATLRKENAIAVGNILGSNISNILLVLNGTLWVSRSGVQTDWLGMIDYVAVSILSVLFAAYALSLQKLTRAFGIVVLLAYVVYMTARLNGFTW